MADKNILEQMLEHLVNDDQAKAEELFHEYVVGKSREIYEELIESEMNDDDDDKKDEDEDEVEEGFDELSVEADDDMVDVDPMGGDATDDLESELDSEMDDEEGDEGDTGELFQDLEDIVDELQSKFDELQGGMSDEEGDMDDMDDEESDMGDTDDEESDMKDDFDLETVREYVEKVDGHGAEKKGKGETADSAKSVIDNMKNDMGGTTANILSGKDGADAGAVGASGGKVKGSALNDQSAKEENAGNINVPGGKAGSAFSKKEPGHGAEKKGSAESADSKQSLFRGRR